MIRNLRDTVQEISPFQVSHNQINKIFTPADLEHTEKVFVRIDRMKKPLEAPYDGPFKVLEKKINKYCILFSNIRRPMGKRI